MKLEPGEKGWKRGFHVKCSMKHKCEGLALNCDNLEGTATLTEQDRENTLKIIRENKIKIL